MKFYSGFSLQNESYLFADYIKDTIYNVSGFSYGAIFALEETQQRLKQGKRVDTLTLLSPAFFQNRDEKFKRLQLMSYKKNNNAYLTQFVDGCFSPYQPKIIEQKQTTLEELQELLAYEWSLSSLEYIKKCGVNIEVYLGGEDKIIDAKSAKEFFINATTVTYIKNANHFLQIN